MDFSDKSFNEKYKEIYDSLVMDKVKKQQRAVIFLGGQPGVGKSSFYSQDNNLNGYIVIDGDMYRKYHPDYQSIIRYDFENYVERTQSFVNCCIERLISDLSDDGYNLIIEGTLRDPAVPVRTCLDLKDKGYRTDMYVIGVNASESWQSTINRANILENMGEVPRLVPIDKYNSIVNDLPKNLSVIEHTGVFDSINIIDRSNAILYSSKEHNQDIENVMKEILDLPHWNRMFEQNASKFFETKASFLNNEIVRRRNVR